VLGVDLSETAIAKARERHPGVEFEAMRVESLGDLLPRHFELVVAMEVLSYVEDWPGALDLFRRLGDRLLVTLYLPPDPIGYVKSFDDLMREVGRRYEIEAEVLVNHEQIVLVGRGRDD
jgi:trans-aconitate methyltransferase